MLVDSHCHLDFPDFADELDQVVARARRAGVVRMVTICTHLSRFADVRAIAERFDDVYCSVGVHPHEAAEEGVDDPAALIEAAAHPRVVAIGESGLDYYYEHSPRAAQRRSFRAHIAAARETGLPLVVHTRDADADTIEILTDEWRKGAFDAVIHCFSTGRQVAEAALNMGFFISLSGILTFKAAEGLREIVRDLPLDRLLVETDAPYLAPIPNRGKRNEPAYVVHTAARMAREKGVEKALLAARTTENFFRLFNKVDPVVQAS